MTVTAAPAAGRKTTSFGDVFAASTATDSPPYDPPATCTIAPGAATRYARLKVRHGCAWEHGFPSAPDGDMKTVAGPAGGQAAVVALIEARPDRLPAAS